nr:integrase, catalytic region, zinc finger, CCHC-type, peptidase aspartic, catalytic [Tanacetum cinerariifolium]
TLLIQGLSNDIYSLIDSNNSAKELWDALRRHMLGSEYGEQDRKVAVLYEYETFKDPLALVAKKTKVSKHREKVVVQSESEGTDDEDISDLKKINAMLAKAFNRKNSDLDHEINTNMIFMAKMEKVFSNLEESSSSSEETIAEVSYYTSDSESEYEYKTLEYYDNSTNYGLFVDNDDDQENFHDAIQSASENFNENHIVS